MCLSRIIAIFCNCMQSLLAAKRILGSGICILIERQPDGTQEMETRMSSLTSKGKVTFRVNSNQTSTVKGQKLNDEH